MSFTGSLKAQFVLPSLPGTSELGGKTGPGHLPLPSVPHTPASKLLTGVLQSTGGEPQVLPHSMQPVCIWLLPSREHQGQGPGEGGQVAARMAGLHYGTAVQSEHQRNPEGSCMASRSPVTLQLLNGANFQTDQSIF